MLGIVKAKGPNIFCSLRAPKLGEPPLLVLQAHILETLMMMATMKRRRSQKVMRSRFVSFILYFDTL